MSFFRHFYQKTSTFGAMLFIGLFALSPLFLNPINVKAAPNSNPIKLSIPFVQVGDRKIETRYVGDYNWIFDGQLTKNDLIRYSWNTAAIDLTYKTYPQAGGGWLRVYLNDDTNPLNALTDYGSSPLPVSKIADKLANGSNKIMFVFVDESNDPAKSTSKTTLSFNYNSGQVAAPKITNVAEPGENSIFTDKSIKNFKVELNNFNLETDNSKDPNKGQLRLYLNEIKDKPLVTIKSSKPLDNNRSLAEFKSSDFDPEVKIPDQKDAKLIFALFSSSGAQVGETFSRSVIMNIGGSLKDIGLPELSITEPRADRVDLSVDGDHKFLLDVKNFNLLSQLTDGNNEEQKGYLQIYVDEQPVKTLWPKTDFTLNEIGYSSKDQGRKTVRLQLVNKDFTKLSPEVSTSVDIIYKSANSNSLSNSDQNSTPQVENSNWRLIIIGIIAVLILGGIAILVIKG